MTTVASLFNGKHAVFAVVITFVPLLPALLFAPLGWSEATGPFLLATVAGMLAALLGGIRLGLMVAAGLTVMEMLALPAAPHPAWAGLMMGLSALLYGLTARRGLTSIVMSAPIAIAFVIADPPALQRASMTADMLALGMFVLIGGLWGTAFGGFAGRSIPRAAPPGSSWSTAWTFGVTMALVTGVTMGVVVATGIGHTGAWILLTILLVIQPVMHKTFRKALERGLGTIVGFGIALAVALLVSDTTALLVLGMLFLTLAVYVHMDPRAEYWHFAMLLTPGIVLAEGAGANVVSTDIDRLWASLTGIAIVLAVLLVFHLLGSGDTARRSEDAPTTS